MLNMLVIGECGKFYKRYDNSHQQYDSAENKIGRFYRICTPGGVVREKFVNEIGANYRCNCGAERVEPLARLSLPDAVEGLPRIATYGLAAICKIVKPRPNTNSADRKNP